MFGVEYNVRGLEYINFVLPDEKMKEFDPEFYNWARKNPLEWGDVVPCWGNLTAMGFWADEHSHVGRVLLKALLRNEFGDSAWEEYFCLNCPRGTERGDGSCRKHEPRDCGIADWGEPWRDRSFTATADDEYCADGKSFDGSYTEQIMKEWGLSYTRGEK